MTLPEDVKKILEEMAAKNYTNIHPSLSVLDSQGYKAFMAGARAAWDLARQEIDEWKAKFLDARKSGYAEGLEEANMVTKPAESDGRMKKQKGPCLIPIASAKNENSLLLSCHEYDFCECDIKEAVMAERKRCAEMLERARGLFEGDIGIEEWLRDLSKFLK